MELLGERELLGQVLPGELLSYEAEPAPMMIPSCQDLVPETASSLPAANLPVQMNSTEADDSEIKGESTEPTEEAKHLFDELNRANPTRAFVKQFRRPSTECKTIMASIKEEDDK